MGAIANVGIGVRGSGVGVEVMVGVLVGVVVGVGVAVGFGVMVAIGDAVGNTEVAEGDGVAGVERLQATRIRAATSSKMHHHRLRWISR